MFEIGTYYFTKLLQNALVVICSSIFIHFRKNIRQETRKQSFISITCCVSSRLVRKYKTVQQKNKITLYTNSFVFLYKCCF